MSVNFTMRQLLEAGVHYGHVTRKWNPKMAQYVFGSRGGIHIMDLEQTVQMLSNAIDIIISIVANHGRVLFVGTKPQATEKIKEAAVKCGQYYVNHRWLGGMLTNWKTIHQSIKRLKSLEEKIANPVGLTKKEGLQLQREHWKLELALGGIREMGSIPDLIIIIDTNREYIAVNEAKNLRIPIVAIVDSNSNPDGITHPIPGNDDAIKAINLYCSLFADAVLEGLQMGMKKSGIDIGAAEIITEDPAQIGGTDSQSHDANNNSLVEGGQ
jgi:small subunit ribosomal protein S2